MRSSQVLLLTSLVLTTLPAPGQIAGPAVTVNVRSFGAQGDGRSDDTEALYRAFCALPVGGTLEIPEGVFLINPKLRTLPLKSHTRITGAGTLKVKDNAGSYSYLLSAETPATYIEDVTLENFTIDQNAYRNASGTIVPFEASTAQFALLFYNAVNVVIRNMTFFASGVNTIVANGPGVRSIQVIGNQIRFQRHPNQKPFDNSAIYIDGTDFLVQGNTLAGSPEERSETAIELHTGAGTATGNTCDWYRVCLILADLHGATASSNTGTHLEFGVLMTALTHHTTEKLAVTGNTFSINNRDRNSYAFFGIACQRDASGVYAGTFSGITIQGNILSFQKEETERAGAYYDTYGIGLSPTGDLQNAIVQSNVILNAPTRGIKIGNILADNQIRNVLVEGNSILDAGTRPGTIARYYNAAIAIDGNLTDVKIVRNEIKSTGTPFDGNYSITTDESRGRIFTGVEIAENSIRTEAGQSYKLALSSSVISAQLPWSL